MSQLIFFIFTLSFSLLINGLFLKFSKTLGVKNSNDQGTIIRWGSTSKPAFGGISFYIVFLASFAFYGSFYNEPMVNPKLLGVLVATSLGFLIGLADDAYNTKPLLKFLGQVLCGLILVYTGNYIHFFESHYLNYALTVFWVVAMMNSINMLDNMDAITTVVSIGSALGVLALLLITGTSSHFYFLILLGLVSSLLGFLYYNWNPSKMYMGDTGSQFLGVLLAAVGIHFYWNNYGSGNHSEWMRLVAPLLAFLPSIVDTTVVIINRLRRRQSPFIGGRDHTTHHLSYMGYSDRMIAVIFLLLSLLSVSIAVWMLTAQEGYQYYILCIAGIYCVVVFLLLFWVSQRKKEI